MIKKTRKIVLVFILLCFVSVGCRTNNQIDSGISVVSDLKKSTETIKIKTELQSIQKQIETYYIENSEYPEDLEGAGIENNILGKDVKYSKLSRNAYEISIHLPDGEEYIISNDLDLD